MDKDMALRLWERLFPGMVEAYDYASHKIRKDDFRNEESEFAWDVDMIKPRSAGGTYQMENLLPASLTTIALRNGRSTFAIGSLLYEVRRGRRYGQFAIYDTTDRNCPIDLTPNKTTQDPSFNQARMERSLRITQGAKEESEEKPLDFDAPLRNTLFNADVEKEKVEEEAVVEEREGLPQEEKTEIREETLPEDIPVMEEKTVEEKESEPIEGETKEEEKTQESIPEAVEEQKDNAAEERVNQLLVEKEESAQRLEEESRRRQELEERIRLLEEQEKQKEEELEKAIGENEKKSGEIERIEGEKEGIRLSLLAREERIQKLESEIAELTRRNEIEDDARTQELLLKEKLLQEKEALQARITTLENEKAEQTQKLEAFENQVHELQVSHAKKDEEIKTILFDKNEIEEKTKEIESSYETRLKTLEEERNQLLAKGEEERRRLEEYEARERKLLEDKENDAALLEGQRRENEQITQDLKRLVEEKEPLSREIESLRGEIASINEKGMANEAILNEKEKELQNLSITLEGLKGEKERLVLEKETMEKELQERHQEKEELKEKLLLCETGGKTECYLAIKERIRDSGSDFDKESIERLLLENPEFVRPDDRRLYRAPEPTTETTEKVDSTTKVPFSFQDDERERKAYRYYEELIGEGKLDATDFASREIKERHYRREDSPFGWDYALFDPTAPEEGNVFIANLKTIAEYSPDGKFYANGHEFRVEEKGGRKCFVSQDTIADPFDFENAIAVSEANRQKTMPLVYIYVKVCGVSSSIPERKEVSAFFDVVDRTVKRCAPQSFVAMQAHNGSNSDYIFLTFDGTQPNAYKEAFDYAILLNSYRSQFKKRGGMDAIVVLDEVEIPLALRHYSFDRLYSETKNVDLNAIRYDLNLTTVINSTIKRTVHIGPEILDKVPIEKERLKSSRLGMGTFSDLFGFGKSYMECNFVFDLSRKADEADND